MGIFFAFIQAKMMFVIQWLFFVFLCKNLIKEIFLLDLISVFWKKALEILFWMYFLLAFFFLKKAAYSVVFLLLPLFFLLFLQAFLKKQEQKNFFSGLTSLLVPLESQMKQGLSFINAWQKSLEELKRPKMREKAEKITEVLKFKGLFFNPDKELENFVRDLMLIHESANPLQRLRHLKRKLKVEQSFRLKSQRALLQIRLQSRLLAFFYFGLLFWTFSSYGARYIRLVLLSFIFFCAGLFWIFKAGRRMKWSV